MTFAQDLAQRACAIHFDALPDEAVHIARRAFADTIGVMLAGCDAPFIDAIDSIFATGSDAPEATKIGRGGKCSALNAARINGVAAHALDFDDCHTTLGGHPSAPLVPAILALAERDGLTAGRAFEAFVTGVETETRLARGLLPVHYEKGWHPTATLGLFGATAASARMLGLDTERTAIALCISVSLAAGSKANFGTPIKPLHNGQAAHNGLMAALMAERGVTAHLNAFEHEQGFFNLFNGKGTYDAEAILADWDGTLETLAPGIAIKQHPCCGSTHQAIDAAIGIFRDTGPIDPETVERIDVSTHERRLGHTFKADPKTGLDAKFSVQFVTVKALLDGRIRLKDFEDATFLRPEIARLLPKVEVTPHREDDQYMGRVKVTLKDGRALSAEASTHFGRGPRNPMSDDDLREKFLDCATDKLDPRDAGAVYDAILALTPDDRLGRIPDMIAESAAPETMTRVAE